MSKIAEGFGRGTQGEFVAFLGYALGSLSETQSHLCAAYDRKYLAKDTFASLFQDGTEIRKMAVAFLTSMVKAGSGVKHQRPFKSWTDQVWDSYEKLTGNKRPVLFETEAYRARAAAIPINDAPPT